MAIRVAVVCNFPPTPADEGLVLRVSRLARSLAKLGPLTLFCRASEEDAGKLEAGGTFARVHAQALPAAEYARLSRIFTEEAMALWAADDDPLGAQLAARHREEPFDVVVCQQVFAANVAAAVPGLPMVLDESDVESQAYRQAIAAYGARSSAMVNPALEAALEEYEGRMWDRAALVTCTTEAEAGTIGRRVGAGTPVRVVPNGADFASSAVRWPSERTGREILFVGTYYWPPNAQAAKFLAKQVLPRVRAEEPGARLVLCGKAPGLDVTLLRKPDVEVTGTVDSVAPYLDRAAVFANALFQGTGSSLKALEAWAAGVPMVSTAMGVRGHPVEPGRHYLPAEDADSFARAILGVFADPGAHDAMAAEARAVAESLSWERSGAIFAEAVAQVVAGCGRGWQEG